MGLTRRRFCRVDALTAKSGAFDQRSDDESVEDADDAEGEEEEEEQRGAHVIHPEIRRLLVFVSLQSEKHFRHGARRDVIRL